MLLWRKEREKTIKTIAGDKREKRGGIINNMLLSRR